MPIFNTEGMFPHDSIKLRALMLWPNDSEKRRLYFAADYANGFVYKHDPSSVFPWSASLIQALLEAPSWSELKNELKRQSKRALVAGYVFTFMFLMDHLKGRLPRRGAKGASISKALFLAEEWAKQGATFGDGTKMLASAKSVKDCWRDFRSVAHFWAAIELNRSFANAPQNKLFHPDHFHDFMRAIGYLQTFGVSFQLDNRSKQSPAFLISSDSDWLIDVDKNRPRIALPQNADVLFDTPFMKLLLKYKA